MISKENFKRNEHMLQAAWLSCFSVEKNEDRARKSFLCIYNVKSKKYLKQSCEDVMLSNYLIDNDIDDSYAKEIESSYSELLRKNNVEDLRHYFDKLFRSEVDNEDILDLINFLSLLASRNKIFLLDYIIKFENKMNLKIENQLEILHLANSFLKKRFETNVEIIKDFKKPIFKIFDIKERFLFGKSINGLALLGPTPIMKLSNFNLDEQKIMRLVAIELGDEKLIDKYWEKIIDFYFFPMNWNSLAILYDKSDDLIDIEGSEYQLIIKILIDLYEKNQILSCDSELIINPNLYENEEIKCFIDSIVDKIRPLLNDRNSIYKKYKKLLKL